MHTLIINGSPHKNGNTAALTARLCQHLRGDSTTLFLQDKALASCTDCHACLSGNGCVIPDDFPEILRAVLSADAVVLASPVWFCTLSVPMLTLISRFQCLWAAQQSGNFTPPAGKTGGILLTCGNASQTNLAAFAPAREALRLLGISAPAEVLCTRTDRIPAWENARAADEIRVMATFLSSDKPNIPPSGMI